MHLRLISMESRKAKDEKEGREAVERSVVEPM
jgi:hypothetical protein